MQGTLARIEQALKTVQATLDALNSRGESELAFKVAKAQFAASIRSSWPANLSPLVAVLEEVERSSTRLTAEEKGALASAIAGLRAAFDA